MLVVVFVFAPKWDAEEYQILAHAKFFHKIFFIPNYKVALGYVTEHFDKQLQVPYRCK